MSQLFISPTAFATSGMVLFISRLFTIPGPEAKIDLAGAEVRGMARYRRANTYKSGNFCFLVFQYSNGFV